MLRERYSVDGLFGEEDGKRGIGKWIGGINASFDAQCSGYTYIASIDKAT